MQLALPSHPAAVDTLASPDQADSLTAAAPTTLATSRGVPPAMAPHMTPQELDRAFNLSKKCTPTEVHAKLSASRRGRGLAGPDLTTVRRALGGSTFRRGGKETRGAKPKLTAVNLRSLDSSRKKLVKKARGKKEVHITDIMKASRVNHVDPSTVAKHFRDKLGVKWRNPRSTPLRMQEEEESRVALCDNWKRLPADYFTDRVDGIMDNKVFDVPIHAKAKVAAEMKHVRARLRCARYGRAPARGDPRAPAPVSDLGRAAGAGRGRYPADPRRRIRPPRRGRRGGHLRTRSEGNSKEFTKPKGNKNRVNPGARVNVAAVIINNRVKVWHYLPRRWCGAAASDLYKDVVYPAMRKCRGAKATYRIVEDNDPTGYKSGAAMETKKALQEGLGN